MPNSNVSAFATVVETDADITTVGAIPQPQMENDKTGLDGYGAITPAVGGLEFKQIILVFSPGTALSADGDDLRNEASKVVVTRNLDPVANPLDAVLPIGSTAQDALDIATNYRVQAIGVYTNNTEKKGRITLARTIGVGDPGVDPAAPQAKDDIVETAGAVPTEDLTARKFQMYGLYSPVTTGGDELTEIGFLFVRGQFVGETRLSDVGGTFIPATAAPSGNGPYSALTGTLDEGEIYSFQAFGRRTGTGAYAKYGQIQVFTTAPEGTIPQDDLIFTNPVTEFGATTATFSGIHLPNTPHGDEFDYVGFVYREGAFTGVDLRSGAEGTDYKLIAGGATNPTTRVFSASVTGLKSATVYTVQAIGRRTADRQWERLGLMYVFSTQNDLQMPVASVAIGAIEVDNDSAIMRGLLTNASGAPYDVTYHFRYGTGYDIQTDKLTNPVDMPARSVTLASYETLQVSQDTGDTLSDTTAYLFRIVIDSASYAS